ncbi:hypothetical protein Pdw03_0055 [Penicillium digitatum]|uniref:Uncharacterized protein n=1 Tax=Penicillium digitatum TaxID=36651 RepID=A0A7T7BMF1_PENDI|nr:hypothetical protein Pdw03_0055 [Penicillium digitatum]
MRPVETDKTDSDQFKKDELSVLGYPGIHRRGTSGVQMRGQFDPGLGVGYSCCPTADLLLSPESRVLILEEQIVSSMDQRESSLSFVIHSKTKNKINNCFQFNGNSTMQTGIACLHRQLSDPWITCGRYSFLVMELHRRLHNTSNTLPLHMIEYKDLGHPPRDDSEG